MATSERDKLRKRIYDDDLYANVRIVLRDRLLKKKLISAAANVDDEDISPPTVFGLVLKERDDILKELKDNGSKKKQKQNHQKRFDAISSKIKAHKDVLEETRREVIRTYARKKLMGIHEKLIKTIRKNFYVRYEIQNYVTWKVSFDNLKGPGYEPGAFIGMMIKRHLRDVRTVIDPVSDEETNLRHAALVKENVFVRDHLLAPFKEIYMPKDTEYTSGAMLKMVTGVNRCAFALNNISHKREYDSTALLFDVARKSGRSFQMFCHELENVQCLRPNSSVIASMEIPILKNVANLFGVYNTVIGYEETGGMNIDCPYNVLFVDLESIHKSLVAECLLWRFVLKRGIGGQKLLDVYGNKYVNGIAPFNLCQEYPGIFGILAHFLHQRDREKFKRLVWSLHTIHTAPKHLDRDKIDTAADIVIELMYSIDDVAAILDNRNRSFDVTVYGRYLTNAGNHFLLNNVLSV